jgi:hypothetical protein
MIKPQTTVFATIFCGILALFCGAININAHIQVRQLFRLAEPSAHFVAGKSQTEKLSIPALCDKN